MNYRINPKNGDKLSALAFGCMRLPRDKAAAQSLVRRAVGMGVNYFDTAYLYPGSEAVLGESLSGGLRDRVNIATKMPPYLVRKPSDFDKIFSTQLERLQTGHIDYYLMHMLTDADAWRRVDALGASEWAERMKREGKIRNFGFSFHGGAQHFKDIIDAYDWDFCMIQYNFLDETNQAGTAGLNYAAEKGVPVLVMEPLRGGKIVTGLPKEARAVWDGAPNRRSAAEWALRWVWNHPEVLTVLSGMNSMEMLEENVRVASEARANELTPGELALFERVKTILNAKTDVPCTGCNYCMPCPFGVDIPQCFSNWNARATEGGFRSLYQYILHTNNRSASLCTACGKCRPRCPQQIDIPVKMVQVAKKMEGPGYKFLRFFMRNVLKMSSGGQA